MQHYKSIADKLVKNLNDLGIGCYIWHVATTGSIYIRFDDNRMCSIRIGNHDGRSKLKYKYNLRDDISINHTKWVKDGDIWRFYLILNRWKELIPVLVERHKQIQSWEASKFQYTIPYFKQKKEI